ncbi:MAG: homoaconitate hydratase [Sulfolobales archaeon]
MWSSKFWFVSPLNFDDEVRKKLELPERVVIHDTTLRDGEQQAGVVFRRDEKVRIAIALDEAGVDRIEAGMPSVSRDDFDAVKEIAKLGLKARVMAFSRCLKQDVDLAIKAEVPGVVMELPSSKHIIEYGYRIPEDSAIKMVVEAAEYAKKHGLFVTLLAIDSTRADYEFLKKVVNSVQDFMDSLTIADTFGVASPFAMEYLTRQVKSLTKKPVEVHPHNDFGLAVANALAAVASGASAVHVTVNGIGERAGNAALEETVLALELLLGVRTNVKLDKLYELSKLVEQLSGVKLPPHKPVVGDSPFRVESGMIAEWWISAREVRPTEVFPILPELVGRKGGIEIVLGKKSGKTNIVEALKEVGIDSSKVSTENLVKILLETKFYSILKKGPVSREEFSMIVKKVISEETR